MRRADRREITLDQGVRWQSLVPVEEPGLDWMVVHYPPGAVSSPSMQRHGGRDYGLVTRGHLSVRLGFNEHTLGPGDAIVFDGSTPHQLRNETSAPVEAVWLVLDRQAV